MPWILFAAAIAALIAAFQTASVGLLVVCLLLSFGLAITGLVKLLAQRVASRSRDEAAMINPVALEELRRQSRATESAGSTFDPR